MRVKNNNSTSSSSRRATVASVRAQSNDRFAVLAPSPPPHNAPSCSSCARSSMGEGCRKLCCCRPAVLGRRQVVGGVNKRRRLLPAARGEKQRRDNELGTMMLLSGDGSSSAELRVGVAGHARRAQAGSVALMTSLLRLSPHLLLINSSRSRRNNRSLSDEENESFGAAGRRRRTRGRRTLSRSCWPSCRGRTCSRRRHHDTG